MTLQELLSGFIQELEQPDGFLEDLEELEADELRDLRRAWYRLNMKVLTNLDELHADRDE